MLLGCDPEREVKGIELTDMLASYLLSTVDAVLAENRSATCGHPDSCQCVAVNLVLFNHPLAFLMLKHKAGSSVNIIYESGRLNSDYRL